MPSDVQERIRDLHGKTASIPLLTHMRRELFHRGWDLLLDDDFMHAYHHGIVVNCMDGIKRRVYPRFFTYSADYPEKYGPSCY